VTLKRNKPRNPSLSPRCTWADRDVCAL
jgi:hypothetical protein